MYITFAIAAGVGANMAPSANTWLTGGYLAGPGQVNGVNSTSNFFRLADVVVLPGTQAPTAAQSPLIMRPYDQELVACARYWQKSYSAGANPGAVGTAGMAILFVTTSTMSNGVPYGGVRLPVGMRVAPTVVIYGINGGVGRISDNSGADLAAGSGAAYAVGDAAFGVYNNSGAPVSVNSVAAFHYTADARL